MVVLITLTVSVACQNGELLVDGGYLNNIPVDVMRSMGVATVRALSNIAHWATFWFGRLIRL